MVSAALKQEQQHTVLVIDDDNLTRKTIVTFLNQGNYKIYEASSGRDGIEKYQSFKPTVLIVDLAMPDISGLDMLQKIMSINPDLPVIVISGAADMESVIRALKLGVCDFLTKPILEMSMLEDAVNRCLNRARLVQENRRYREHLESEVHAKTTSLITQLSERRKVDRALRRSELRFQSVIENANDIIVTLSFEGNILSLNQAFENCTNMQGTKWLGAPLIELMHPNDRIEVQQQLQLTFSGSDSQVQECRLKKMGDGYLIGELIASPLIERDEVVGVLAIIRDITERKQAEKEKQQLQMELLQSQKLESIGRLAGGVAHDFNNALTAILGFSDLALAELPRSHPIREYVEVIKDAGEKAAALTRQLLAFGRKQILKVEQVCINTVVTRMGRMLQRLIGDDVLLHLEANALHAIVLADQAQMEQVIMNLVINARDAMPKGGELWVTTENVNLSQEMINQEGVKPGLFVLLTVRDTGIGMTDETQAKIFEPFYTTKDPGKGTGLGLATVFGVLSQHNGFISTKSRLNHGTTFKAYLPVMNVSAPTRKDDKEIDRISGGSETILVVDDEPAIRRLLMNVLKKYGYQIFQAGSGEEALEIARNHDAIDLLLTDMVMPGINGKTLSDRMKLIHPSCEMLYMSGYAQSTIDQKVAAEIESRFIQKPLKPYDVVRKIRDILDAQLLDD